MRDRIFLGNNITFMDILIFIYLDNKGKTKVTGQNIVRLYMNLICCLVSLCMKFLFVSVFSKYL